MKLTVFLCSFIFVNATFRVKPIYRRVSFFEARRHSNFHPMPRARIRKASLKVHLKEMIVMRRNLI